VNNEEDLPMGDMAAACRDAAAHLHEDEDRITNELKAAAGDGGAEDALQIVGDWQSTYAPQLHAIEQWLTDSAGKFHVG
jgi:hypothetical protein